MHLEIVPSDKLSVRIFLLSIIMHIEMRCVPSLLFSAPLSSLELWGNFLLAYGKTENDYY